MKAHRIFAILLRHLYATRRSLDRLTDIFYWPTIDLAVWGLTSSYFQTLIGEQHYIFTSIITGLVLWLILYMASNSIALTILQDLWDRNLMNILVSPISWVEWMVGNILLSLVKIVLSFTFTVFLSFVLYKVSILHITIHLMPHVALLVLTSWWVAFIIVGSILRFGTRIQTLAWALVAVISPFSAIYYPLSSLSPIAQFIARFVPSSYVFESVREVISLGYYDYQSLLISLALNLIYFALSLIYLKTSINRARQRGLASLY